MAKKKTAEKAENTAKKSNLKGATVGGEKTGAKTGAKKVAAANGFFTEPVGLYDEETKKKAKAATEAAVENAEGRMRNAKSGAEELIGAEEQSPSPVREASNLWKEKYNIELPSNFMKGSGTIENPYQSVASAYQNAAAGVMADFLTGEATEEKLQVATELQKQGDDYSSAYVKAYRKTTDKKEREAIASQFRKDNAEELYLNPVKKLAEVFPNGESVNNTEVLSFLTQMRTRYGAASYSPSPLSSADKAKLLNLLSGAEKGYLSYSDDAGMKRMFLTAEEKARAKELLSQTADNLPRDDVSGRGFLTALIKKADGVGAVENNALRATPSPQGEGIMQNAESGAEELRQDDYYKYILPAIKNGRSYYFPEGADEEDYIKAAGRLYSEMIAAKVNTGSGLSDEGKAQLYSIVTQFKAYVENSNKGVNEKRTALFNMANALEIPMSNDGTSIISDEDKYFLSWLRENLDNASEYENAADKLKRAEEKNILEYEKRGFGDEAVTVPVYRDKGFISANYSTGSLGITADKMGSLYAKTGDARYYEIAKKFQELSEGVATQNYDDINPDNLLLNVAANGIQNLPQQIDTLKEGAKLAPIAAAAVLLGVPIGYVLKGLYVTASAKSGYEIMRGEAMITLTDMGLSFEDAKKLSANEGFINALIESGDAVLDIMAFGVGKALAKTAVTKLAKGVVGAPAKAAASALLKLGLSESGVKTILKAASAVGAFTIDVLGEGAEEWFQSSVTMANADAAEESKERKSTEGENVFKLASRAFTRDYTDEEKAERWESAKGGVKGGIFFSVGHLTAGAVTQGLYSAASNKVQSRAEGRSIIRNGLEDTVLTAAEGVTDEAGNADKRVKALRDKIIKAQEEGKDVSAEDWGRLSLLAGAANEKSAKENLKRDFYVAGKSSSMTFEDVKESVGKEITDFIGEDEAFLAYTKGKYERRDSEKLSDVLSKDNERLERESGDNRKSPQKNKLWVHRVYTKANVETGPTGASSKIGLNAGLNVKDNISQKSENVKKVLTREELFHGTKKENLDEAKYYFLLGKTGEGIEKIYSAPYVGGVFTDEEKARAWSVGKNELKNAKRENGLAMKDRVTGLKASELSKTTVRTINALYRRLGAKLYISDTVRNEAGQRVGGQTDIKERTAYISHTAKHKGLKGEALTRYFAVHEAVHLMFEESKEAFNTLYESVPEELLTAEAVKEKTAEYEKSGITLSGEAAREEIVAEFIGEAIANADRKTLHKIIGDRRSVGEVLLDMVDRLINAFKGVNDELISAYKNARRAIIDALSELEGEGRGDGKGNPSVTFGDSSLYTREPRATKRNGSEANRAEGGAYDYSKSFAEQIDDWKNGKIPKRDSLIVGATPEVLKKIGLNALPVTINQTHIDYALNNSKDKDHYFGEELLKQIPEAIKNPIAVIKSSSVSGRIIEICEITVNGKNLIVPIEIDGYAHVNNIRIDSNAITSIYGKDGALKQLQQSASDEVNGNTSVFYINTKKANALLQRAGLQLPGGLFQDGFIHSIREKGAKVNTKFKNVTETQQFKRWFGDWENDPKRSSKVVNEDGTPKVVYHGTSESFTVFDKEQYNKNEASGDYVGEGFFFTESEKKSQKYGNNIFKAYLDIKNPLVINTEEDARNFRNTFSGMYEEGLPSMRKFIGGAYDYFELMRENPAFIREELQKRGYDGLIDNLYGQYAVFSPNQIKSATDNIGTFDRGNDDIRYAVSDEAKESKKDNGSGTEEDKEKYLPKGEAPFRDIDILAETEKGKTSRFIRTVAESEFTTEEAAKSLQKAVEEGAAAYDTYTDKKAVEDANSWFEGLGSDIDRAAKSIEDLIGAGALVSKEAFAKAQLTYNKLIDEAVKAGDTPRAKELLKRAENMIIDVSIAGTKAGQTVQAMRLIKRLSPEGRLTQLKKAVDELNGKKKPDKEEAKKKTRQHKLKERKRNLMGQSTEKSRNVIIEILKKRNTAEASEALRKIFEMQRQADKESGNGKGNPSVTFGDSSLYTREPLGDRTESGAVENGKRKIESVKRVFGIKNINDYINVQKSVFETLKNEGFFTDEGGRSRTVTNKESGLRIEINKSSIDETFSSGNKFEHLGKDRKYLKLATIKDIAKLIENAHLTSDSNKNYHSEKSGVKYAYLEAETTVDGTPVTVVMDIRKSPQKNKFWVHQVYTKKDAKVVPTGASSKMGLMNLSTNDNISQNDENVKYAVNEGFAQEIANWWKNGRRGKERFILGSTGNVLQGLGAIESDIYINADKINKILEEHAEITVEEIKKIPEISEDPIIILKSRNENRGGKQNTRLVVFGSVKGQDGRPILSVLDLRPVENNFVINDMQKISSVYTKDSNPVEFLKNSEILYADKKRAANLLRTLGFQMPNPLRQSGFIGSISYFNDSVNIEGKSFSEVFEKNDGEDVKYAVSDEKSDISRYEAMSEDELVLLYSELLEADAAREKEIAAIDKELSELSAPSLKEQREKQKTEAVSRGKKRAEESVARAREKLKAAEEEKIRLELETLDLKAEEEALNREIEAAKGEIEATKKAEEKLKKTAEKLKDLTEKAKKAHINVEAAEKELDIAKAAREAITDYARLVEEENAGAKLYIPEDVAEAILKSRDAEELDAAMEVAAKVLAEQMPARFMRRRWREAWRYLAMLLNPTTHERNILSNTAMYLTVGMKDFISGAVSDVYFGAKERKSTYNVPEYRENSLVRGFGKKERGETRNWIKEVVWNDVKDSTVMGGMGKGKDYYLSEIMKYVKPFKTKAMNKINDFNFNLLELEDVLFLKANFTRAFQNYMVANNLSRMDMARNNTLYDEATRVAAKEAREATFRDVSKLANSIRKLNNKHPLAGEIMFGGNLPFTRTPFNIAKRGAEYSVLGLGNAVYKKARDSFKHEYTYSDTDFINDISKGLTGSALHAAGMLLYGLGAVFIGSVDSDDEDKYRKERGEQNFSIKIGGYTYTIDWLQPACIPFLSGAALMKLLTEEAEKSEDMKLSDMLSIYTGLLEQAFEPLIQTSVLSSFSDALSAVREADNDSETIVNLFKQTLQNYAGQYVPSVLGKIARTIDPYERRYNYVKSDSPFPETEYFLRKTAGKIPGLSRINPPYVDMFGQEAKKKEGFGDYAMSFFENMLSPGYLKKLETDKTDEEIIRLSKTQAADGKQVLNYAPPRTINLDRGGYTEKRSLTGEEYFEIKAKMGDLGTKALRALAEGDAYKSMSDTARAEAADIIWDVCYQSAVSEVVPDYHADRDAMIARSLADDGEGLASYAAAIAVSEAEDDAKAEEYTAKEKERIDGFTDDKYLSLMGEAKDYLADCDAKEKTEAASMLYAYAKARAKSEVLEDYYLTGTNKKLYSIEEKTGLSPADYISFEKYKKEADSDKNGSYTQAEISEALRLFAEENGARPEDLAYLWQLETDGLSANNPYGAYLDPKYYKASGKEKRTWEKE